MLFTGRAFLYAKQCAVGKQLVFFQHLEGILSKLSRVSNPISILYTFPLLLTLAPKTLKNFVSSFFLLDQPVFDHNSCSIPKPCIFQSFTHYLLYSRSARLLSPTGKGSTSPPTFPPAPAKTPKTGPMTSPHSNPSLATSPLPASTHHPTATPSQTQSPPPLPLAQLSSSVSGQKTMLITRPKRMPSCKQCNNTELHGSSPSASAAKISTAATQTLVHWPGRSMK